MTIHPNHFCRAEVIRKIATELAELYGERDDAQLAIDEAKGTPWPADDQIERRAVARRHIGQTVHIADLLGIKGDVLQEAERHAETVLGR